MSFAIFRYVFFVFFSLVFVFFVGISYNKTCRNKDTILLSICNFFDISRKILYRGQVFSLPILYATKSNNLSKSLKYLLICPYIKFHFRSSHSNVETPEKIFNVKKKFCLIFTITFDFRMGYLFLCRNFSCKIAATTT